MTNEELQDRQLQQFGEKHYYSFAEAENKEEWIREFLGPWAMQYMSPRGLKDMTDMASNCHPLQGLLCLKYAKEDLIQNIKDGLLKKVNDK
jgi:hypothetical protein